MHQSAKVVPAAVFGLHFRRRSETIMTTYLKAGTTAELLVGLTSPSPAPEYWHSTSRKWGGCRSTCVRLWTPLIGASTWIASELSTITDVWTNGNSSQPIPYGRKTENNRRERRWVWSAAEAETWQSRAVDRRAIDRGGAVVHSSVSTGTSFQRSQHEDSDACDEEEGDDFSHTSSNGRIRPYRQRAGGGLDALGQPVRSAHQDLRGYQTRLLFSSVQFLQDNSRGRQRLHGGMCPSLPADL